MCLVVVAVGVSRRYPLVIAANRDEQHGRPATAAAWWADRPQLFAGRDLAAGGTWLAVDRRGRMAAVTNIRESTRAVAPRSRGALVTEFVAGHDTALDYALRAAHKGSVYGPFNLLLHDGRELHYTSNRAAPAPLGTGLHAFSNAPREVEWPKLASARAAVLRVAEEEAPIEPLFSMLAERGPDGTGEERYRTAHFVVGPSYGTRCSTVVLISATGRATFAERTFDRNGRPSGETSESFNVMPSG
jgi:uncharacterized protein with NRDE domain